MIIGCSDNFQELDSNDEDTIRQQWKLAISNKRMLYDGIICNFKNFQESDVTITIKANKIRYSYYFVKQYAALSPRGKEIINPLTVGSITITSDGQMVMGRRQDSLVAGGKLTPLPQGFVSHKDAALDPVMTIYDRFKVELDIDRNEIQSVRPLGFVHDNIYGYTMLIYATFIRLSSDNVLGRSGGSDGKSLTSQIFFVGRDDEALGDFLSRNSQDMTGDCIGSLLLFGKDSFTKSFLTGSKKDS